MSAADSAPKRTHGLSGAAERRLTEELAELREQRRELAASLSDEQFTGDRADQADMLERAAEIDRLDDRISEIAGLIAGGNPPDEGGLPPGTEVTLRFPDGSVETLRLIGTAERLAEPGEQDEVLTPDSPLGRALVGHGAGDDITYPTPGGEARAHVVSVHLPGECAGG
ncbi:MAG: GreA/GreB family elongation factor [Pseudonocardiaceae bacterium]